MELFERLLAQIDNLIWLTVCVISGGAIAYLKTKKPKWADTVLYGLAGTFLTIAIFTMMSVWSAYRPSEEQTTPENIKEKIREWLDAYNVGSKLLPPDPGCFFAYEVPLADGVVNISRLNANEGYIMLLGGIEFTDAEQEAFHRLSNDERHEFLSEIRVELNRFRAVYVIQGDRPSLYIQRRIPINSSLDEGVFLDEMDQLNSAIRILLLRGTNWIARHVVQSNQLN